MDSVDTWVKVVSQLGFPIMVCIWFMWRDYKFISSLLIELTKLNELIEGVLSKK